MKNTVKTMTSRFGQASIKNEGSIADPDEYIWECDCEKCKAKYSRWKEQFDKEQKELRDDTPKT